jgi:hypothetical protein
MTTFKPPAMIAGLIAALFAATLLAGTPAAAGTRQPVDPYGRLVITALDTCDAQGDGRTYDSMTACVGRVAAPDPYVPFQLDLWDVFRECLYLYYKGLDGRYGESSDVNKCLESHGYDVGLP